MTNLSLTYHLSLTLADLVTIIAKVYSASKTSYLSKI